MKTTRVIAASISTALLVSSVPVFLPPPPDSNIPINPKDTAQTYSSAHSHPTTLLRTPTVPEDSQNHSNDSLGPLVPRRASLVTVAGRGLQDIGAEGLSDWDVDDRKLYPRGPMPVRIVNTIDRASTPIRDHRRLTQPPKPSLEIPPDPKIQTTLEALPVSQDVAKSKSGAKLEPSREKKKKVERRPLSTTPHAIRQRIAYKKRKEAKLAALNNAPMNNLHDRQHIAERARFSEEQASSSRLDSQIPDERNGPTLASGDNDNLWAPPHMPKRAQLDEQQTSSPQWPGSQTLYELDRQ